MNAITIIGIILAVITTVVSFIAGLAGVKGRDDISDFCFVISLFLIIATVLFLVGGSVYA